MKHVKYSKIAQSSKVICPSDEEVNKVYEAGDTRVRDFVIISADEHTINMFEVTRLVKGKAPAYKDVFYTVTEYITPEGAVYRRPSWMSKAEFNRNIIIKLGKLPSLRKHTVHML